MPGRRARRSTPRLVVVVASLSTALSLWTTSQTGTTSLAPCASSAPASAATLTAPPTTSSPGPATPTAPASTPAPSPSATPRTATVTMSGDLLWHSQLWKSAAQDRARTGVAGPYDFDPMFAALKPVVTKADMAICHGEVPFAAKGATPSGYPSFAAPAEIAPWIKSMGWDLCTTASNHALDQGFTGWSARRTITARTASSRPGRSGPKPSATHR